MNRKLLRNTERHPEKHTRPRIYLTLSAESRCSSHRPDKKHADRVTPIFAGTRRNRGHRRHNDDSERFQGRKREKERERERKKSQGFKATTQKVEKPSIPWSERDSSTNGAPPVPPRYTGPVRFTGRFSFWNRPIRRFLGSFPFFSPETRRFSIRRFVSHRSFHRLSSAFYAATFVAIFCRSLPLLRDERRPNIPWRQIAHRFPYCSYFSNRPFPLFSDLLNVIYRDRRRLRCVLHGGSS